MSNFSSFDCDTTQHGQRQSEKKTEKKLGQKLPQHESLYVHNHGDQHQRKLQPPPPLSNQHLLSKSTSKCEHCEHRFTS